MFDDLSVFDAEDVDGSLAAVLFIELDVVGMKTRSPSAPMCLTTAVLFG